MRRGRRMVMWVSKMKTRETGDWVYSCIGERGRFPDVCLVHLSVSVCHQNRSGEGTGLMEKAVV